jgi:hypothetical protein
MSITKSLSQLSLSKFVSVVNRLQLKAFCATTLFVLFLFATFASAQTWPFLDDFNRTACTSGCGSGGGLGSDYAQINTTYPVTIISNAVSMAPWSAPGSTLSGAVVTESGYTFTANQYAEATVKSMISDPEGYPESIYLILRYADANNFNYVNLFNPAGAQFFTVSGGVANWVGDYSGGITEGHVYRVEAIGNAYTLYDNGVRMER